MSPIQFRPSGPHKTNLITIRLPYDNPSNIRNQTKRTAFFVTLHPPNPRSSLLQAKQSQSLQMILPMVCFQDFFNITFQLNEILLKMWYLRLGYFLSIQEDQKKVSSSRFPLSGRLYIYLLMQSSIHHHTHDSY